MVLKKPKIGTMLALIVSIAMLTLLACCLGGRKSWPSAQQVVDDMSAPSGVGEELGESSCSETSDCAFPSADCESGDPQWHSPRRGPPAEVYRDKVFHYGVEWLGRQSRGLVEAIGRHECRTCGLLHAAHEAGAASIENECYYVNCRGRSVTALFRTLDYKLFVLIKRQQETSKEDAAHAHDLAGFYTESGGFEDAMGAYHRWGRAAHKKLLIAKEDVGRARELLKESSYWLLPAEKKKLWHEFIFSRNMHNLSLRICRALGHQLGEEDCSWLDPLVELLYELVHGESPLKYRTMGPYIHLASFLYPINVHIACLDGYGLIIRRFGDSRRMGSIIADRPGGCPEAAGMEHITYVKQSIYFVVQDALAVRADIAEYASGRRKGLLDKFLGGCIPDAGEFTRVADSAPGDVSGRCTQIIVADVAGWGFVLHDG